MSLGREIWFGFALMCVPTPLMAQISLQPDAFVAAARRGDENAVRRALALSPALLDSTDEMGLTALDWAATREHWSIFNQLLKAGADVSALGFDGGAAIHRVAHHDRSEQVLAVIRAGADPHLQNQWGRTPLHVAARRGHVEVAKVLVENGADLEAATREGWTPLHVANRAGQPDMVRWLLEAGADPDAVSGDGEKPAESAFRRPPRWGQSVENPWEYQGHYRIDERSSFSVRAQGGELTLDDLSVVRMYPTGHDSFFTEEEPWSVRFHRDPDGRVQSLQVDFLRRSVTGTRIEAPEYVGSERCGECHAGGSGGAPYVPWLSSQHASAYWRLATDWALALATQQPHFSDLTAPVEDSRCLNCHTTGALDDGALFAQTFRIEEGVGCEVCHGPRSRHAKSMASMDSDALPEPGGGLPDEATCKQCHRNPDTFSFDEWWPKIAHGRGDRPGIED